MIKSTLTKVKLFLLFSLFVVNAFSQSNYFPGSVIVAIGDTLHGEIDRKHNKSLAYSCDFRDEESKDTVFYPKDIVGFHLNDGRFFVAKNYLGELLFLEFLIEGELNLYVKPESTGDRYFIDKVGLPLSELEYAVEDIIGNEGGMYRRSNTRYLGVLKCYMNDSPELLNRVDGMKSLEQKSLITLAEDYHYSICDGDKCINYTKTIPKVRFRLEPYVGVNYHNAYYTSQQGVFLDINSPLNNENLHVKIGLAYSSLSHNRIVNAVGTDVPDKVICIPFYIQYVIGTKKLKPSVGLGCVNGKFEFCLQTGLNYGASDNFSLVLNGSIDSVFKLFGGAHKTYYNNSFGHSFSFGCQFKLN